MNTLTDILQRESDRLHQNADKYAELMRIGKRAADSLRSMVAALNCDYERLKELRSIMDDVYNDAAYQNDYCIDAEKRIERREYTEVPGYGFRSIETMIDQFAADDFYKLHEEAKELRALEAQAGDCSDRDEAEQCIQEDALSVEVRSDWYSPGGDGESSEPVEFKILLSTGGPASRIVGELQNGEPVSARLEVQDWFQPWTEYNGDEVSESVLLDYCRCFYFGEG